MNINLEQIISVHELAGNTREILRKSENAGCQFVFEDNKPKYVVMSIRAYQRIIDGAKGMNEHNVNLEKINTVDDSGAIIEALNAIGKRVFVDYYEVFKDDDSPEDKLPKTYTLNSRRSRSSKARKLFRDNNDIEALMIILESDRIDDLTKSKALEIIKREAENTDIHSAVSMQESKEVKIGKLAKDTLVRMLSNRAISREELRLMQTFEYSKETFNLNYPLLKLVEGDPSSFIEQRTDSKGYSRYYSSPVMAYGKKYFLCSQWVEGQHRTKLERWIKSKQ